MERREALITKGAEEGEGLGLRHAKKRVSRLSDNLLKRTWSGWEADLTHANA